MAATNQHFDSPPRLWIALIWFGIGLFDATQTVVVMRAEGMHHNWAYLFITLLVSWLPWALGTMLILRLGRRYPPTEFRQASTWLTHLVACAGIGLVSAGWTATFEVWLNPWAKLEGPGPFLHLWVHKFYNTLLGSLILYASILAISYVLDSRERLALHQAETARLSEALSKAQLDALRRQMEPHFLFNTLNAIAGLVREKRNDAAVSMIAGLSNLLRRFLEDSDRQEVALREEMEFLQNYLDIQKVRFADRLQCDVQVPAELLPAQVPALILQPMAENAIRHGIAKRAQGGAIRVAASRSNGMLCLKVYNDGPKLTPESQMARSGIGLSNVRTRLQSLYGEQFELSIRNQEPGGVEVSISIPFREK